MTEPTRPEITDEAGIHRQPEDNRKVLPTDDARQGERRGVITILAISITTAVVLLGLIFAIFGS